MKQSIIFCAIIIAAMLVACKDNTTKVDNNVLHSNMSYIPLQVGNEWLYKRIFLSDTTIVFSKIIDSININNKIYFIIVHSNPDLFHPYIGRDSTVFLRTSDGITYYQYFEGEEHIYRIFKDTTVTENKLTGQMVMYRGAHNRTHPLIGNVQFFYVEVGGGSEPDLYTYAKGLGLINFAWFKGYCELVSAKVNDKIYE